MKTEMKNEALLRLNKLVQETGLNPKVIDKFKEEIVYYSYLTAGGLLGSIDTLSYEPKYVKIVKDFENKNGCLVYHCIESIGFFGKELIILYVGSNISDWEGARPDNGNVMSYVYSFTNEIYSEFGYVQFSSLHGALVRIG